MEHEDGLAIFHGKANGSFEFMGRTDDTHDAHVNTWIDHCCDRAETLCKEQFENSEAR